MYFIVALYKGKFIDYTVTSIQDTLIEAVEYANIVIDEEKVKRVAVCNEEREIYIRVNLGEENEQKRHC